MTSKFDADDPSSEDRGQSLAFEDDDDEVDVDDLSVDFVKEWVMKSPKILLTFADIPYKTWCYVGILPKDRDFITRFWKTWLFKAMINSANSKVGN